jgi:hypothetical protein
LFNPTSGSGIQLHIRLIFSRPAQMLQHRPLSNPSQVEEEWKPSTTHRRRKIKTMSMKAAAHKDDRVIYILLSTPLYFRNSKARRKAHRSRKPSDRALST